MLCFFFVASKNVSMCHFLLLWTPDNEICAFLQLHLSTPSQEFNREEAESQRRIMDGSPPTPRSLRLDPNRSAGPLSASQEELRR